MTVLRRSAPGGGGAVCARRGRAAFFSPGGNVLNNMVLAAAYVVMAPGLNIIVGFAGLLDLEFFGGTLTSGPACSGPSTASSCR